MRVFQHKNGYVTSSEDGETFTRRPKEWTEVQIAPLDAVVIPADVLPKVEVEGDDGYTINGAAFWPGQINDAVYQDALALLALHRHLELEESKQTQQVRKLAELLAQGQPLVRFGAEAERLYKLGVRVTEEGS